MTKKDHAPVLEAELMHNLFHLVHLLIRRCGALMDIQSAYVIGKRQENDMETYRKDSIIT